MAKKNTTYLPFHWQRRLGSGSKSVLAQGRYILAAGSVMLRPEFFSRWRAHEYCFPLRYIPTQKYIPIKTPPCPSPSPPSPRPSAGGSQEHIMRKRTCFSRTWRQHYHTHLCRNTKMPKKCKRREKVIVLCTLKRTRIQLNKANRRQNC